MNTKTWSTRRRDVVLVEFEGGRVACRSVQVEATPQAHKVDIFMAPNDETDGAWQGLTLHLPDGSAVEVRGSDWYWVDVRRPDRSLVGFVSTDAAEAQP